MVWRGAHLLLCVAMGLGVAVGCSSQRLTVDTRPNDGSTLTTVPGEPVEPAWLLGKWDLDGSLTNRANGRYVPLSDIRKDLFGQGWKFEPRGVLKADVTGGYEIGSWWLERPDVLHVELPGSDLKNRYRVHFRDGYLYLKDIAGLTKVFEKDKFFGF